MKLYYSKGACSLAIRITLNELHLEFEAESVDLKQKTTQSGENYLAINPKGCVPALKLNNHHVLTENTVIHQYLADHYPSAHLLAPASQYKRYQTLEWLNHISTDLHKACSPLFNAAVSHDLKESIFKPILCKNLAITHQQLSEHTYLMGENYSLPDAYLFVVLSWLPKLGINVNESFPALARFMKTMQERPAVKKSLEQEGLASS